jgi:predicted esterase
MMFKSTLTSAIFAVALALSPPSRAALIEQSLEIVRVDGSPLEVVISRPSATGKMPMVLAIDGSLCIPSRLNGYMGRLSPETSGLGPYALVTVEKPEPTLPAKGVDGSYSIGPDFQCTDTFKKYYSIDQRVLDHLRAIQYLRRQASWWDGRLFLWGFSDGARIASRVGAFTPETQRMALGGFGGGMSMAAEFEEFHICPAGRTKDRDACLKDLRAQFKEIRDNPTRLRTWNGDSNTWAAWASRLDGVEANILKDVAFPVLVFHGTEDKSVPVASARSLAKQLTAPGNQFVYREIDGMGHGLGSNLPSAKGEELQREILTWLLGSSSR